MILTVDCFALTERVASLPVLPVQNTRIYFGTKELRIFLSV